MTNVKSQITSLQRQLEAAYPKDEALALAWWIAEELSGLSRTQLLCGCKDTTNFSKLQDFCDKNDLCSHKNPFIAQKDCSSQENANVTSGEDDNQAESEDTIQAIIERLLHFEPIQYIFGHTLWCGLDLKVTPATLTPRPETAELVEAVSNCPFAISHLPFPLRVLDIGTGSGCIAIALKKRHPEWEVTGIDISAEAIEVAKENARRNGVEVEFRQADIFHLPFAIAHLPFDVVVSNPPYICNKEKGEMRRNVVDYEPHTALFVPDEDPLLFYRRIATLCAEQGKPVQLFFEINEAYAEEISAMLGGLHYSDIRISDDMYGKPRIIEARMAL